MHACLEVEAVIALGGEVLGIDLCEAEVLHVALASRQRRLGQLGLQAHAPRGIDLNRQQVGVGQIAVVVRVFLLALQHRLALHVVPAARGLHAAAHHAAIALPRLDLAHHLVLDGALHGLEAVQVLHLDHRGADLGAVLERDGHVHVGLEAHVALLHHALGHAKEAAEIAQFLREGHHLIGAVEVGRGDDLEQRRAGAIEIDQASVVVETAGQLVAQLAGVLLQVRADDADALGAAGHRQIEEAVAAQRLVVLADLIALGQVGIEVVLAIPVAVFGDGAVQRQAHHGRHLHGALVHDRQRSGQRSHQRIDQRVRLATLEVGMRRTRRAREHLAARAQFHMDLESDDDACGSDGCGRRGHGSHHRPRVRRMDLD